MKSSQSKNQKNSILPGGVTVWPTVQGRSISSFMLETVFKMIPLADKRESSVFDKYMEDNSKPYQLPDGIQEKYGVEELDDFTDTFLIEPKEKNRDLVILYLHGGGYWSQPLSLHFQFFNKIANQYGAPVIFPIYPKAPAYDATDVHAMIKERYNYLLTEKHISPDNILLMGESAGGGLALAFLQVLRDQNLPMPKQVILISPWLDVTGSNKAMDVIEPNDPLLLRDSLVFGGITYAGNLDPKDPLVSPIYGNLSKLPPVTVFTGTHDILDADIQQLGHTAKEQNLDYTIYTYEKMNHGFVGFPIIPEAKDAIKIISSIVQEQYPLTK